jgi:hypothetical protein
MDEKKDKEIKYPNFTYFMKLSKANKQTVIMKFNQHLLQRMLQESTVSFSVAFKNLISNLIKQRNISFTYTHRLKTCLYMRSSSVD